MPILQQDTGVTDQGARGRAGGIGLTKEGRDVAGKAIRESSYGDRQEW